MKRTITAIFMCAVMVLVAAVPLALASTHTIIKGEKGPNNSAVTWEYVPTAYGNWSGHIVNSGLRWLVVEVFDNTSSMLVQILHQRIRFAAYDAYPSGVVDTQNVTMALGRVYSITVTPNGPRGSSCIVEDMFKAAIPPVAIFSVVVSGLNVVVNGSDSYDPDGTIVSYDWSFDDGSTASGPIASHTYARDGTYLITLIVTDNDGIKGEASQSVTVAHVPERPIASFTTLMDWMTVTVDASASSDPNGLALTYAWDFGDGLSGVDVKTTHTYASEGTYTITLTVTNTDLLSDTATASVTAVMPPPPIASFTTSMDWMTVTVDASASSDPRGLTLTYAWDFGDGLSGVDVKTTHTYAAEGTYTITLTVTNTELQSDTATASVTAVMPPPPVASFTYTVSGATLDVDASGSTAAAGIVSYSWDWGDGSALEVLTSPLASHTYSSPPVQGPVHLIQAMPTSTLLSKASGPIIYVPGPPLLLYGYLTDSLGNPVAGADVTIRDTRTGVTLTTVSLASGFYQAQLADMDPGYAVGDTISVTAVKGNLAGTNSVVITGNEPGVIQLNITLLPTGPVPHDYTVTLTVTDTLGRSNSVSQIVTVYW